MAASSSGGESAGARLRESESAAEPARAERGGREALSLCPPGRTPAPARTPTAFSSSGLPAPAGSHARDCRSGTGLSSRNLPPAQRRSDSSADGSACNGRREYLPSERSPRLSPTGPLVRGDSAFRSQAEARKWADYDTRNARAQAARNRKTGLDFGRNSSRTATGAIWLPTSSAAYRPIAFCFHMSQARRYRFRSQSSVCTRSASSFVRYVTLEFNAIACIWTEALTCK